MLESDEQYIKSLELLVKQTKNDLDFEEKGLCESVLDRQLEINSVRNEHNIVDREEILFEDEEGVYVQ